MIEEDVQSAGSHGPGVQQADGTGGGVPGVGEGGLLEFFALAVDLLESLQGEEDFAPGFDVAGLIDDHGQGLDGLDVGRHVVAPYPVAARHGPGVFAVPVEDGDAEPVDFEFGRVFDYFTGKEFPDPRLEVP